MSPFVSFRKYHNAFHLVLFAIMTRSILWVHFENSHASWIAIIIWIVCSTLLWQVLHETFHRNFFTSARWNDRAGIVFSVFFGAPYEVLKKGHLLHHRMNRQKGDRTEVYEKNPQTFGLKVLYFFRLFGGLYLGELASNIFFLLPVSILKLYQYQVKEKNPVMFQLMANVLSKLPQVRFNCLMNISFIVLTLIQYSHSALGFLLSLYLYRALAISLMDNVYHYGSYLNQKKTWI